MKEIQLNFEGYWRECNKGGLPSYSGIYLVYRCVYNDKVNRVTLMDIIYIGKSDNIHDRHIKHEKLPLFEAQLQAGEQLCYSCAKVDMQDLEWVENALIFAQKPILNDKGKEHYDAMPAHIQLDGCCACMNYNNFNIR